LEDVPLDSGAAAAQGARLSKHTSVRNAVSQMLETNEDQVVVIDDDGSELGVFRLTDAGALL
jgi:signal-transduction protein with cAMP-binding, CBS, and nucleotidyltransferase domain